MQNKYRSDPIETDPTQDVRVGESEGERIFKRCALFGTIIALGGLIVGGSLYYLSRTHEPRTEEFYRRSGIARPIDESSLIETGVVYEGRAAQAKSVNIEPDYSSANYSEGF